MSSSISDASAAAVQPKVAAKSVLSARRTPVTRWSRPVIALVAVILAGLLGAAFWIGLRSGGPPPPRQTAADANADVATTRPAVANLFPGGYGDPAVHGPPGTAPLPPPGEGLSNASAPGVAQTGITQTGATQNGARPLDPAIQAAREQARAAKASGPFFGAAPPPTAVQVASADAARPEASGAFPPRGWTGADPAQPAKPVAVAIPEVQPANGQGAKRAFITTARSDDVLAAPLRAPLSPWEVKAGTVIPAALLTAINSDLPGEIIAVVTEPVYDHATGRTVLIPQGARLIGQYDSQVAYGQERALIAWTRIVMPDGRSINIGSMAGADLSGAAGLGDQVDGHFWQLARGVVLSTLFSMGAASAQDAGARSSGQLVLNSAGTGVASGAQLVGQEITRRDLMRQPTLRVRAGWPLSILVNKDIILAPYPTGPATTAR